jgi:predicted dehydrogenase
VKKNKPNQSVPNPGSVNRREFIKRTAAAMTLPLLLPHSSLRAESRADERVRLAWIGVGQRGNTVLRGVPSDLARVIAICDVDEQHREEARERYPDARFYSDFRVMLREMSDAIDAVGIATPDHTHFAPAYMAISMGKHVFLEKPLTHTVWEARTLMNLADEMGVKTQMGNQGHASEGIRLVREWYQAGLIGEVEEVIGWTNRPHQGWGFRPGSASEYPPGEEIPPGFDWDQWLGPVSEPIAYNPTFHTPLQRPNFWRHWWAFGTGGLGDIGTHTLDTPFWAMDLGSPRRIAVNMQEEVNPIHKVDGSVVTYHFDVPDGKPPVQIKWYEGPRSPKLPEGLDLPETGADMDRGGGLVMVGDKGVIAHTGMRPNSPRLYPDEYWERFRADPDLQPPRTLPRVRGGIMADFLNAIREDGTPTSNFNYGARLTEAMLLGTLAIRTGKPIEYDAANMRIPNNPEAEMLLKLDIRDGWDIDSLV